jgi:ribosomal protein L19E
MAQILKKNWFDEKLGKMRDTLQLLNALRNNKTVDNTTYQNFRNLYRKELTKAKKTFNERFIHKAMNKN